MTGDQCGIWPFDRVWLQLPATIRNVTFFFIFYIGWKVTQAFSITAVYLRNQWFLVLLFLRGIFFFKCVFYSRTPLSVMVNDEWMTNKVVIHSQCTSPTEMCVHNSGFICQWACYLLFGLINMHLGSEPLWVKVNEAQVTDRWGGLPALPIEPALKHDWLKCWQSMWSTIHTRKAGYAVASGVFVGIVCTEGVSVFLPRMWGRNRIFRVD